MAMDEKTKKPLAKLAHNSGAITRGSLWLADDHLLYVASNEIRESYQRFYLRDIKGFLVTGSNNRTVTFTAFGMTTIMLGLFLLAAILSQFAVASIVLAVLFALSGLLAALVYFRARTHHVHILTRVQTVALGALKRRAQIDRVFALLTPLIEAAQTDLTPSPPPAATVSTSGAATPPPLAGATATLPANPPPPIPPEDIRAADSGS